MSYIPLYGDSGRFVRHVSLRQFARMLARGQVEESEAGGRILPFAAQHAERGGRTRTASGGAVPHQVYTTRDGRGNVDGFKFIASEDLDIFYGAVLDCLAGQPAVPAAGNPDAGRRPRMPFWSWMHDCGHFLIECKFG